MVPVLADEFQQNHQRETMVIIEPLTRTTVAMEGVGHKENHYYRRCCRHLSSCSISLPAIAAKFIILLNYIHNDSHFIAFTGRQQSSLSEELSEKAAINIIKLDRSKNCHHHQATAVA
ncbi:hypothetical protein D917_00309, partial [Trichinella nativa]